MRLRFALCLVVLSVVGTQWVARSADEPDSNMQLQLSLDRQVYYRGAVQPVEDLIAHLTITNTDRERVATRKDGTPLRLYDIEISDETIDSSQVEKVGKIQKAEESLSPDQRRQIEEELQAGKLPQQIAEEQTIPIEAIAAVALEKHREMIQEELSSGKRPWQVAARHGLPIDAVMMVYLDKEEHTFQVKKEPQRVSRGEIKQPGRPIHYPAPQLTPEGYVEFEIYRVSPPTGEDAMDAPVKVGPIVRTPPLQRTGRTSFPPEESLEPQESKTYDLNVGYHYNITTPGRYTMRVHFENQTSNEVSFEVAPIKRVGVAPDELVSNLSRYEGGEPQYPYMFYVAPTRARHDLLFVMHRVGEGAERHFERKDIAHVQVDSLPQVMARGKRVGILVKDPYQLGQWHAFTIDLSSLPLQIERKTYELDPESRPSLAGGVDGLFTIESEPVPPSAIHIQRAFPRTPSEE